MAVDRSGLGFSELLDRVIDDGIEAVKVDYADARPKREGAIAGFGACRGKAPSELRDLFGEAHDRTRALHLADADPENYWYARCYELEVEWVCNVLSAVLVNEGFEPIIPPTARGVMKAAEIVGVRGQS